MHVKEGNMSVCKMMLNNKPPERERESMCLCACMCVSVLR